MSIYKAIFDDNIMREGFWTSLVKSPNRDKFVVLGGGDTVKYKEDIKELKALFKKANIKYTTDDDAMADETYLFVEKSKTARDFLEQLLEKTKDFDIFFRIDSKYNNKDRKNRIEKIVTHIIERSADEIEQMAKKEAEAQKQKGDKDKADSDKRQEDAKKYLSIVTLGENEANEIDKYLQKNKIDKSGKDIVDFVNQSYIAKGWPFDKGAILQDSAKILYKKLVQEYGEEQAFGELATKLAKSIDEKIQASKQKTESKSNAIDSILNEVNFKRFKPTSKQLTSDKINSTNNVTADQIIDTHGIRCTDCNARLDSGATILDIFYCPNCGIPIDEEGAVECENCNCDLNDFGDDIAYCYNCGTEIDEDGYRSDYRLTDIIESTIIKEVRIPGNIESWARDKGCLDRVKLIARWVEKVSGKKKYISGGTAIGKHYDTLVLDIDYQDAAIYLDCYEGTFTLYKQPVGDYSDFKAIFLNKNTVTESCHEGHCETDEPEWLTDGSGPEYDDDNPRRCPRCHETSYRYEDEGICPYCDDDEIGDDDLESQYEDRTSM